MKISAWLSTLLALAPLTALPQSSAPYKTKIVWKAKGEIEPHADKNITGSASCLKNAFTLQTETLKHIDAISSFNHIRMLSRGAQPTQITYEVDMPRESLTREGCKDSEGSITIRLEAVATDGKSVIKQLGPKKPQAFAEADANEAAEELMTAIFDLEKQLEAREASAAHNESAAKQPKTAPSKTSERTDRKSGTSR